MIQQENEEIEIKLTEINILEKEFPIDTRGYRMVEVDKFLDIIRRDYQVYNRINKDYSNEIERLTKENEELRRDLRRLKEGLAVYKNSSKEITNIDILKRLSQLEKTVYGNKE